MSGLSTQSHKIWIEQCEAAEGIRERKRGVIEVGPKTSWISVAKIQRHRRLSRSFTIHARFPKLAVTDMRSQEGPRGIQAAQVRRILSAAISGSYTHEKS